MCKWLIVSTTAVLVAAGAVASLAAEAWFLMARHGECAPVSSLARKFPDLGAIADPEAFVRFVRAKGLRVTTTPLSVQAGAAREVLVPEKELSLVFVTAELCAKARSR